MSKKFFITGTGTDIGKTYITALIVKKLHEDGINVAYYKAAMSGNDRDADGNLIPGDALHVKTVSGIEQSLESMCPYVYENAYSPHLASKIEGNPVELSVVLEGFDKLDSHYDYVISEGSGGILCPLRCDDKRIQLEDFVKARDMECIIVADAGLGTINSVVLTVDYMKRKNIAIKGLIFNNYEPTNILHIDNIVMCEMMTGLETLACVERNAESISIDI